MPDIRDARRQMYREQILTAAEHEFSRSGFTDARMESIAATAGVSLATVYKTFSGKLDIWDALHDERMRLLLARVDLATQTAASPLQRLLTGVATVARFLTEHEDYLDLNLRAGISWASGADGGRGVQRTVWSAGLDRLARGIEAAIAAGELPDIRPRVGAGMIVSALQVWLADWAETARDRQADTVIDELTTRLRWLLTGQAP
ncbi:TetR/AcrR family transcriptional regulator [Actinomadura welshii]|uniref:TetR/AcrR family transcriptional regulator n=1 Tax=Actinomadura welshii TaxID=3103817 RepID=UPI00190F485C|nr:TetR/AcrR family transcriptional regulator [Actinomadura madurae]